MRCGTLQEAQVLLDLRGSSWPKTISFNMIVLKICNQLQKYEIIRDVSGFKAS